MVEDTRKEGEYMENEYVRIKVHKTYLTHGVDPSTDREYNALKMPPGVRVGERDLSNATIFPRLVYEDKFNSNMVIAQYDKTHLKDNAINVSVYDRDKRDFESIRIDIDELKKAVDVANKEYLAAKKRAQEKSEHERKEEVTY